MAETTARVIPKLEYISDQSGDGLSVEQLEAINEAAWNGLLNAFAGSVRPSSERGDVLELKGLNPKEIARFTEIVVTLVGASHEDPYLASLSHVITTTAFKLAK